ncbi:MAG: acyl-CoA thioesterase [Lachnospiraceae bacterium]|nr:acyl-CoA thioesterase [Lachnospiraceae bacterium]
MVKETHTTSGQISRTENSKKVEDSVVEQAHLLFPAYLNSSHRLFGGQLMMWIDEVAGIVARRHCETRITTAAVDNLQFKEGAKAGEVIVLVGRMTYVGSTSMEVRVDTYVEGMDGIRKSINRAYVVEVAVDENMTPVPVPRLELHTPEQFAEWENGEKRYNFRKKRRQEGF